MLAAAVPSCPYFPTGKLLASRSFNIGTIRILDNQDKEETWNEMRDFIREHTKQFKTVYRALVPAAILTNCTGYRKKKMMPR